ncbi:MAG: hypothetical protein OXH94_16175 [Rhodospirillales bacterium]|nr:hypothetical protein [Rhodospirillales bacterium]
MVEISDQQEREEAKEDYYTFVGSVISNHELMLLWERMLLMEVLGGHTESLLNELDAGRIHHQAEIHLPSKFSLISEDMGKWLKQAIDKAHTASKLRNIFAHAAWTFGEEDGPLSEEDTSKVKLIRPRKSKEIGGKAEVKQIRPYELTDITRFVANCNRVWKEIVDEVCYNSEPDIWDYPESADWSDLEKRMRVRWNDWLAKKHKFEKFKLQTIEAESFGAQQFWVAPD